jgi:hypothetical protein
MIFSCLGTLKGWIGFSILTKLICKLFIYNYILKKHFFIEMFVRAFHFVLEIKILKPKLRCIFELRHIKV